MLALQLASAAGMLTVAELGRWRELSHSTKAWIDEVAPAMVERRTWGVDQPRARGWHDLSRLYGHWYCCCCCRLAPAGLCGQWRGQEYVEWCLGCHLASEFPPLLHPPELPWNAVPHYGQIEPAHFLRRVLRAHQLDQGKPAAHHDCADHQHVQLSGIDGHGAAAMPVCI